MKWSEMFESHTCLVYTEDQNSPKKIRLDIVTAASGNSLAIGKRKFSAKVNY